MAKVEAVINQPVGKANLFKQLLAVEQKLNKQFDTQASLVRLGARVGIKMPSVATGIRTLDDGVIQTGGIPRGRIIEIFGPESAGKTTVTLHIIGCEQKQSPDKLCGFVDAEHALDPTYAQKLGVNVSELVVSQPDTGEQALETVIAMVESGLFSLIAVDSVAALVPRAELEGDMGDSHMGLQARLMSQAMRKLTGICAKSGVTVIFINQIREKIGVVFGNPETTTGGRALKFYASVRLDVRRREAIKSGDVIIGHTLELKAVKNKMGAPFRTTKIDLIYEKGIDIGADLVQYGLNSGVIIKSGAWYSFKGENIGQGKEATIDYFSDSKNRKSLDEEIAKAQAAQEE